MVSTRIFLGLAAILGLLASARTAVAAEQAEASASPAAEATGSVAGTASAMGGEKCTDGVDNDNDEMVDCADADCFDDEACQPDGAIENTNARCSDWIDNDEDGVFDCDDEDCLGRGVDICKGSWQGPLNVGGGGGGAATLDQTFQALPNLEAGVSVEDLIGRGRDKDGERNDMLCSDGIDNDDDGMIDCADYGCRFDPSISICTGSPDLRFSVVASVGQIYDITENTFDTRFTKLQLRTFGPLPYIQDSFFLLSFRTEKTTRNTFAMFQVPIGREHFVNVNSGGGGLSSALIISDAKQLMLDAPYYVYNAFEQGNGAAIELSGPIVKSHRINYRVFAAGGSGRFNGNIGGRYFRNDNTNYTYAFGGQLTLNVIGFYNRFDTLYLYTPTPMTLGILIGAKYDQRANERYPAANLTAVFRWRRVYLSFENYSKKELTFGSFQTAYVCQAGFLLIPKRILLAADFGQYLPGMIQNPPPDDADYDQRPLSETQARAALHWYFWRNIGLLSIRYQERTLQNSGTYWTSATPEGPQAEDFSRTREVRAEVQYRF